MKHWCYDDCGAQILKEADNVSENLGFRPSIILTSVQPLIMHDWWTGLECPHGNQYWLRPTQEQIEQWEAEGVE